MCLLDAHTIHVGPALFGALRHTSDPLPLSSQVSQSSHLVLNLLVPYVHEPYCCCCTVAHALHLDLQSCSCWTHSPKVQHAFVGCIVVWLQGGPPVPEGD